MNHPTEIIRELPLRRGAEPLLPVTFEVPGQTERVEVAYAYPKAERRPDADGGESVWPVNCVDIGLQDADGRFRGTSGSARGAFFVAENEATPGYLRGPLPAGEWTVWLAPYKISEAGFNLQVEIRIIPKTPRWLRGDLHLHSQHSDGHFTTAQLAEEAARRGLDFVFLTDHNTVSQNAEAGLMQKTLALPGMEWTMHKGHANLLGAEEPLGPGVNDLFAPDAQACARILERAQKRGALVVLNHPFDGGCPWEWGFDVPFDAVEIWNGPFHTANLRALQWWHARLCEGARIPAVGGSDFHFPELFRMVGTPTIHVFCAGGTRADILDALRGGRAFITFQPDAPTILLHAGERMMGDMLDAADTPEGPAGARLAGAELAEAGLAGAENVRAGDRVRLLSAAGVEAERTAEADGRVCIPFTPKAERLFYRVEVWRRLAEGLDTPAAISNPLYVRAQKEQER